MDNADRVIRALYTDADLGELFLWDGSVDAKERASQYYTFDNLPEEIKPGGGPKFWGDVVGRYMWSYPKDHNEDEIWLILRDISRKCCTEEAERGVEGEPEAESSKTKSSNVATVFSYCANQVLAHGVNGSSQSDPESYCDISIKRGRLLEWHGLINKINENVLIAAFQAARKMSWPQNGKEYQASFPRYDDERLNSILEKGYAETHAHLYASGYVSDVNWYMFLFQSDDSVPLAGDDWSEYKGRVASFAQGRRNYGSDEQHHRKLIAFLKTPLLRKLLVVALYQKETGLQSELLCVIERLFRAASDFDFMELKNSQEFRNAMTQYEWLCREKQEPIPRERQLLPDGSMLQLRSLADAFMFIGKDLVHSEDYKAFEQSFLRAMFEWTNRGDMPLLVAYAFNAYIAAYTQFVMCVTHDNLLMGFRRFSKADERKLQFLRSATDRHNDVLCRTALNRLGKERGLKKAELRVGASKVNRLDKLIEDLDFLVEQEPSAGTQEQGEQPLRYGIVVHFSKSSGCVDCKESEPRKKELLKKTRKDTNRLLRKLELKYDEDSWRKMIAIDAAGFEIGTRPEAMAPYFRRIVSEHPSMHMTYHVGEDFVTLCDGLRAIDEALEFLGLRKGDRLGHCIALGVDADQYFRTKRGYITSTLQGHVDDAAWLYGVIKEHYDAIDQKRILNHLEKLFFTSAYELGIPLSEDRGEAIDWYYQSWLLRGDSTDSFREDDLLFKPYLTHRRKSWYQQSDEVREMAQKLYRLYQFDGKIKKKGMQSYVGRAASEYIEAIKLAQRCVRKRVRQMGLTIETNPSSNKKISAVNRFIDLPFLRFNNAGLRFPERYHEPFNDEDIPISINTDDSGIFQTNLATEYAYVAEALRREGFDSKEVYEYIDALRQTSLDSCFVPDPVLESHSDSRP